MGEARDVELQDTLCKGALASGPDWVVAESGVSPSRETSRKHRGGADLSTWARERLQ